MGYYYRNGKLFQGDGEGTFSTVTEAQQNQGGLYNDPNKVSVNKEFEAPTENTAYLEKLQKYNAPTTTTTEATPETVPGAKPESSGGMSGGVQAAQTAMQGGSALDTAGSGMTSMGMATASPYLVGAGLSVQALSSIQKGKNQREQNKYLAKVQQYNQRQDAISKMAQLGQSLKA